MKGRNPRTVARDRRIVALRATGLSYKEIASAMDVTDKVASMAVHRWKHYGVIMATTEFNVIAGWRP